MRHRPHRPSRWCPGALALLLALPGSARAAPDARGLPAQAAALEGAGRLTEAAALWERAIAEAPDEAQRMLAYYRAIDAWLRAFEIDGELAFGCAARAILTRALADEGLDVRARDELSERFDGRATTASECAAAEKVVAHPVQLLDPAGPLAAHSPSITADAPRRSPRTIVGATLLGLAAPVVGGLVYAVVTDARVAREVREERVKLDTTGEFDDGRIAELRLEANRALGLEIGFGIASAAVVGAAVGLMVTGRREDRARRISVAPRAGVAFGGVVLSGRF